MIFLEYLASLVFTFYNNNMQTLFLSWNNYVNYISIDAFFTIISLNKINSFDNFVIFDKATKSLNWPEIIIYFSE